MKGKTVETPRKHSIFNNIIVSRWVYIANPILALFSGVGFLIYFDETIISSFMCFVLCEYFVWVYFQRIKNFLKEHNMDKSFRRK